MYYLKSRYYNPFINRFINTDKVIGANDDHTTYDLYTYCGNNPITRHDIGGMSWIDNIKNAYKSVRRKYILDKWEEIKSTVRNTLNKSNKIMVAIGIDTAAIGAKFLKMSVDENYIYHADFDCWQQYFGYNNFYDFMFDVGTSMETVKFPFKSKNKDYILWAWKGNYINLGAGAELGIYTGGGSHWKVDKKLAMKMWMKLFYNGQQIIYYTAKTWWITSFNPNPKYFDVKASQLQAIFTVMFSNETLYKDFKDIYSKKKYKNIWSFDTNIKTARLVF